MTAEKSNAKKAHIKCPRCKKGKVQVQVAAQFAITDVWYKDDEDWGCKIDEAISAISHEGIKGFSCSHCDATWEWGKPLVEERQLPLKEGA